METLTYPNLTELSIHPGWMIGGIAPETLLLLVPDGDDEALPDAEADLDEALALRCFAF